MGSKDYSKITNSALNDFDLPVNKSKLVNKRISSLKASTYNSQKLEFFDKKNIFDLGRFVESINIDFEDVICTTYFTSKNDPQRKQKIETNRIEYIAPWYNSMKALDLRGIVFYDDLSKEFVENYKTEKILFIKCTLGNYSLNDERFILYYMFFLKHKAKNILLTDGNDVIIKKNPFNFIESKTKSTIFVGRGENNKLIHSKWNLNSIDKLLNGLETVIPNNFYEMAIYNAGIIGGNYYTVMYFLRQICSVFFKINNNKNNNMPAMHYVLYYYFFPNCRTWRYSWLYGLTSKNLKLSILKKTKDLGIDFILKKDIDYNNDSTAISSHIFSGFPLNSKFKFYNSSSDAFIVHK